MGFRKSFQYEWRYVLLCILVGVVNIYLAIETDPIWIVRTVLFSAGVIALVCAGYMYLFGQRSD